MSIYNITISVRNWRKYVQVGGDKVNCYLLFLSSDENDSTPLHIAAEAGSISNVKLLVSDERDLLKAEDNMGRTPLHIACAYGYRNIVSFLLESGADPLARMESGQNCMEVAVIHKQEEVVKEMLLSDLWKDVS